MDETQLPPLSSPHHPQKQQIFQVIIITAIIVAALASVGTYVLIKSTQPKLVVDAPALSPTLSPVPTSAPQTALSDWKEYTNNEFGYSIKYPAAWYIHNSIPTNRSPCLILSDIPAGQGLPPGGAEEDGHQMVQLCYVDSIGKVQDGNGPKNIVTPSPFSINGHSGYRFTLGGSTMSTRSDNVYLRHPDSGYIAIVYLLGDKTTYEEILSTFTFTTPTSATTQTSIPADWKTYDKTYLSTHYSFSYPTADTVYEGSPGGSTIELITLKHGEDYIMICPMARFYNRGIPAFQEYKTGSRREWFISQLPVIARYTSASSLIFTDITVGTNKAYLKVEGFTDLWANSQYYFGIQNGKSLQIVFSGTMDQSTINSLLASLSVS